MTKSVACAVLALFLTACATSTSVQTVKVAVPIPCQAEIPPRPVMPTEALKAGVDLDRFVQAAAAEIERREGYEGKLLAALEGCVAPVPVETPALPARSRT